MARNREDIRKINEFLIESYQKLNNKDYDLIELQKIIYEALIKMDIPREEQKIIFTNQGPYDFFDKWIKKFKSNPNLNVFCHPDYSYFCQFVSTNSPLPNDNCIKIYVPLDSKHIYKGVNKLFKFISSNNIIHESKIASEIRNDNIVIRVSSPKDVDIIQNFIDNDTYIQEGLIKANPFYFEQHGLAYSYGGSISSTGFLATLIADYLLIQKQHNREIIHASSFFSYLEHIPPKRIKELSQIIYKDKDPKHAICLTELLKISLKSNNIIEFYDYFNNNNTQENTTQNQNSQELFNEMIITMMKKYPLGYDPDKPYSLGKRNIFYYLQGIDKAITEDNNLRTRVTSNLSKPKVLDIIYNSGIPGYDINRKLDNYINMTILNEIIRNMEIKYQKSSSKEHDYAAEGVEYYRKTGDITYITHIGEARTLAKNLPPNTLNLFLQDMGINNIIKYKQKYYDPQFHKRGLGRKE